MPRPQTHSPAISKNSRQAAAIGHVRIIGGTYRRRQVSFIDADGLRPTPDRVRETLFNWLQGDMVGISVLDCCAGSGVLGFEALSHGASHVVMIEPNQAQFRQLQHTQRQLNISDAHLTMINAPAEHALSFANVLPLAPFGGVFVDPPFDLNLWQPILERLLEQNLINADSWLYIESDRPHDSGLAPAMVKFEPLKYKKMGQVFAGLYQLKSDCV